MELSKLSQFLEFQFHKVRLKVMRSILRHQANTPFQFHKVRLKEEAGLNPYMMMSFQFHKVRLKDSFRILKVLL